MTTARLPAAWNDPAGSADNNSWGATLNTFLRVSHNADGTLKSAIGANVKTNYGATGDGVTDDSAAIQSAINAVAAAGGGVIYFPASTYVINSQITFPNDGATPPQQKSLRLTGDGPSHNGRGGAPNGGTILSLGFAGSVAKIDTRGAGFLELDHLTLKEPSVSTTTPFIQTTNTTLHIHAVEFYGAKVGTACAQDAIILGGTGTTSDGTSTAPFQGYGTVIEANYFNGVRRVAYLRTYANGVQIVNNAVFSSCGSNLAGGAAIELDGAGQGQVGNYIAGNLIEVSSYPYGIKVVSGSNDSFIANHFYDSTATTLALYRFETDGKYNLIIDGYRDDAKALVSDANSPTVNTAITSHQSQTTTWIGPWLTKNTLTLSNGGGGPIVADASNNQFTTQLFGGPKQTVTYTASGGSTEYLVSFYRVNSSRTQLLLEGTENAITNVTGGISATTTASRNLRGSATFATAATKAVAFANAEPDATYFITISGSVNEAFWVTAKGTGGFTLNSSNATSTAIVDWVLIR